jgi:hypothetical protein
LSKDGQHSVLFDEVLLALEQTDYCDFEVILSTYHIGYAKISVNFTGLQ